jgi:hypothetical protein
MAEHDAVDLDAVIVGAEVDAPRLVGWIMAAQRVEARNEVHTEEKTRVGGVCGGDDAGVVAVGGDVVGVLGVIEYGGLAGALVGEVHAEERRHRLESAQAWSNWKSAAGSLRWVHRVVPPRVRLQPN